MNKITITSGIELVDWKEIITAYIYEPALYLFPEEPKSFEEWNELFLLSTAVHFASSQTGFIANTGNSLVVKTNP